MVIENIIKKVEKYNVRVVSFDVFDTLLFRLVKRPTDIFLRMYEKEPELFPSHTNGEDFSNARKYAEKQARDLKEKKYDNREVTLEDIYVYLPKSYKNVESLIALEFESELENTFVNKDIEDTIQYLKNSGRKIILTSDMYLGEIRIRKLLDNAGCKTNYFERIYVSCDYDKSKNSGKLYEQVIEDMQIDREELLHVGDNYYSDIGVTNKLGILNYHYDIFSNGIYNYPFIGLENQIYKNNGSASLLALRLLSSHSSKCIEQKDFWYDIGAMIVGPFLTYATEWILDIAEENHVKIIRPLMREGKFICDLIKNSSLSRGKELSIEPIYISRLSVFASSFDKINADIIKYLISTYNMKTKDVFEILHVSDLMGEYEEFADVYLNELSVKVKNGTIVQNSLLDYLCSPVMIDKIRERNEGSSDLLYRYLEPMELYPELSITVDFGWRGSIQHAINKKLSDKNIEHSILHLLYISRMNAIVNVADGTEIRGFLGNWGSNEFEILAVFARILELFFYCEEGTTIGYEDVGGQVIPVTKQIKYSEWQKASMLRLQEGVLEFQKNYLRIVKTHQHLVSNEQIRNEVCNVLLRLCSYPLKQEADILRKLEYDQNFGANVLTPIIDEHNIVNFSQSTFDDFYGKMQSPNANWFSGLNVIKYPGIYLKNSYLIDRKYKYLSLEIICEKAVENSDDKPIVVVGAGKNAKMVIMYFNILGNKKPLHILDNNEDIHYSNIGRIPIYPVKEEYLSKDYFYLFSVTYADMYLSLREQIRNILHEFDYISYFNEDVR